ncbi:hypothetical protein LEP1GSC058_0838 [Leptospira fainei serovar Hurstbridge str. BUT 6]|uniref:Uncharacterized protein n=1 Tax=Leptospira fainei serovar Hurstbridge str. BUT 6 TaxID=1193011 RepID=S3V688_9LEPT|nr:hypothetical protein LEP1GSC058_0838 [Leptospira fainei serovar Hurstbridge str. BUT 6]
MFSKLRARGHEVEFFFCASGGFGRIPHRYNPSWAGAGRWYLAATEAFIIITSYFGKPFFLPVFP